MKTKNSEIIWIQLRVGSICNINRPINLKVYICTHYNYFHKMSASWLCIGEIAVCQLLSLFK